MFARLHTETYAAAFDNWEAENPDPEDQVQPLVISVQALERRLLSGFLAETPVPDLAEVESSMVGKFFAGPLEAVGFVDLTDLLEEEGLRERINEPSFAPWTSRGRIFGIPHDVHPVMLAYRADIVEAAGIDVTAIETWDDFERIMRPLMWVDGTPGIDPPDRYLLNLWETSSFAIQILLLQAGGGTFDQDLQPILVSDENAKVFARMVTWVHGPRRLAINAPNFSAEGHQMFLDGQVLCNLMPDWLAGVWRYDLPGLKGKVKLMPLPAWEPGGRRTSVIGGTMLAIPKRTDDFDTAWRFAKHLYFDPETSRETFRSNYIITPIRDNWDDPVFDEPSAYFSGQPVGRLYINLAPDIPMRSSSPFESSARNEAVNALIRLTRYARENGVTDEAVLRDRALVELREAEKNIERLMRMNPFWRMDEWEEGAL